MPDETGSNKRQCSLLLFVATPAEEDGLKEAARNRGLPFEKIRDPKLGEYHWLGPIGNETVIAVRPSREGGKLVMGFVGRLGSAARAIHFQEATGARGIVQLGMAFGINPIEQRLGDVLVSTALIPYDNRDVVPNPAGSHCIVDYSRATPQPARIEAIGLFEREKRRGGHAFGIHFGMILSGGARIRCGAFRDELVRAVPRGEERLAGGDMEAVGLLSASTAVDEPIWCVVKGISDFADEDRDPAIQEGRGLACRNSAGFVLSALANDAAP